MGLKGRAPSPYRRWRDVAELVRLAAVSAMVTNIEAPVNVLLVGPPGDGKTAMLLRAGKLPNVQVLSDTTYLGLCSYLRDVKEGLASCLIVPDLGTIAARRDATGKQAVATMAMMCAEGVRMVRIGKSVRDYGGATSSVLSAITLTDLDRAAEVLDQNAFLSRVFVIDFDLSWPEQERMMQKKLLKQNRSLLSSFRFPSIRRDQYGLWRARAISVPRGHARRATRWWVRLRKERKDRWFAFRTADALVGLMQAAAFVQGRTRVQMDDVRHIEKHVLPLVQQQVNLEHL